MHKKITEHYVLSDDVSMLYSSQQLASVSNQKTTVTVQLYDFCTTLGTSI